MRVVWGVLMGVAACSAPLWAHADPAPTPAPESPSHIAPQPPGPTPNASILQTVNDAKRTDLGLKAGFSPAILRAEVMLDRLHVSPGVIDGRDGANFAHAVAAYARKNGLKDRSLDQKVWDLLVRQSPQPALKTVTTTDAEVAGPFYPDLPTDYAALAKLPTIGYRSASQKLGAEFHMGEDLLAALNPSVDLGKSGHTLVVADTTPAPFREKVHHVVVDKTKGQVVGYDHRGRIVVAMPATIGSRELPSPSGTYRIKGIAWNPKYYYDPKNFVQGDNKEKLTLPPGPNNPVGSVFMALTKPTYGLHGTPDPLAISKTASHGCVRMTNWDAEALAKLVKRGVVVHFEGRGGAAGRHRVVALTGHHRHAARAGTRRRPSRRP